MKQPKASFAFATYAVLLLITSIAAAQSDATPVKRLHGPAAVKGFIGGESHDSYVIQVRKGQVITVRISWEREDDNKASFTVSPSPDFYAGDLVQFGEESEGGKRWTGESPKTGDYYIHVVAHPTARYTLRVTVT